VPRVPTGMNTGVSIATPRAVVNTPRRAREPIAVARRTKFTHAL
jgi:hypothetical protein